MSNNIPPGGWRYPPPATRATIESAPYAVPSTSQPGTYETRTDTLHLTPLEDDGFRHLSGVVPNQQGRIYDPEIHIHQNARGLPETVSYRFVRREVALNHTQQAVHDLLKAANHWVSERPLIQAAENLEVSELPSLPGNTNSEKLAHLITRLNNAYHHQGSTYVIQRSNHPTVTYRLTRQ